MIISSVSCKPPAAVCLFPKARKFYAACNAINLSHGTKNTMIKTAEHEVVNFFRSEADDWRIREMGRSHFKSPDLLAKLKLISMLLIAARFGKVHFVQVCNSDEKNFDRDAVKRLAITSFMDPVGPASDLLNDRGFFSRSTPAVERRSRGRQAAGSGLTADTIGQSQLCRHPGYPGCSSCTHPPETARACA